LLFRDIYGSPGHQHGLSCFVTEQLAAGAQPADFSGPRLDPDVELIAVRRIRDRSADRLVLTFAFARKGALAGFSFIAVAEAPLVAGAMQLPEPRRVVHLLRPQVTLPVSGFGRFHRPGVPFFGHPQRPLRLHALGQVASDPAIAEKLPLGTEAGLAAEL